MIESAIADRGIRAEITLETAPAPARLATNAMTILADLDVAGEEVGSGRLVILHEPEWQEAWDGNLRMVAFARSELETELVTDSMLLEVGWSWVVDSFKGREIAASSLSGTVSRAGSQSFGDLSARTPEGSVEIRYSWTILDYAELPQHVLSWCDLLASAAGLEPLPDGVVALRVKDA
jgi:Protein of unknown function (DUF3000)